MALAMACKKLCPLLSLNLPRWVNSESFPVLAPVGFKPVTFGIRVKYSNHSTMAPFLSYFEMESFRLDPIALVPHWTIEVVLIGTHNLCFEET